MGLPRFEGECLGCGRCVVKCPGLAITLVCEDYDLEKKRALVVVPFEFGDERIPLGREVATTDLDGEPVGAGTVVAVRERQDQDRRRLLAIDVPYEQRLRVAGFAIRARSEEASGIGAEPEEDPVVCRCERIRRSEIVDEIRAGVRDVNQLKALSRASMGACNGKTCSELIGRIFREEGISPEEVVSGTVRPLVSEIPLGSFVSGGDDGE